MSVQKNRGFTVLELMIVLTIVAIVTAFAIPSFRSMQINSQISGLSAEAVQSVHSARMRAITTRQQVSLVQGPGASTTDITVPTTAGDWAPGWRILSGPIATATVFSRTTHPRDIDSASGAQAIKLRVFSNATVDAAGSVTGTDAAGFAFNRYGQLVSSADGTTLFTQVVIVICAPNVTTERGRAITVSPLGQLVNTVINNPSSC